MSVVRINRGSGHSYVLDGKPADGVTTLLDDGIAKPALVNWAGNTTAAYAVDHWDDLAELTISARYEALRRARFAERDAAARRGTQVHALGQRLVNHEEIDVPEELAGHVESYVRFLDTWHVVPLLVETTIANRSVGYCGTFDLVATVPARGDTPWLFDIKTGRSGIYPETALQLAAYAHAECYVTENNGDEHEMPAIGYGAAIHVRADGFDVVPVSIGAEVFTAFRHVAWVARRMRVAAEWLGEALEVPAA